MIKETKKAPTIRFRDFTDDWEQRKFRDMVVEHNAGIYINKKDYGTGINIIGVGDIYDSDKVDGQIYRLAPVKNSQYILEKDDIIYGESSLVPQGIARTMYVTKNGAGTAFAWHTRRVKLDKNLCNSHFITLEMNYNYSVRKYLMKVSTQTALTGMTTAGYFGALITLPTLKEQNKVSKLFTSLDAIILLHQRKLDQLKTLKKYFLQNMFPAKGEKVPRIRFKGFTGDWEQRKLSTVTDCIDTGKSKFSSKKSGLYKILGSTSIIGYDDTYDYEGNFLLTARVGANAGNLYRYAGKVKISDNTVFIQSKHIDFLFCLLTHFDIKKLSFGTGQPLIKASELRNLQLLMPVNDSEKEKIGKVFSDLDNFITLHQRKLDQLQTMKKFMLQNMFI